MTDLRTTRALIAELSAFADMEANRGDIDVSDRYRRAAAALSVFTREDNGLDGRTCSYCFKRPATAVDDDLDAICSECAEPIVRTVETAEEWEYGSNGYCFDYDDRRCRSMGRTLGELLAHEEESHGGNASRPKRRHPASAWEPVPPTPETEESDRG